MAISAGQVKELRERTGAGMMDCKKALVEATGDVTKAADLLRERGLAKALKKAGRAASEGRVQASVSDDGRIGALVEVKCETDFVAKTDEFEALAASIAGVVREAKPADVDALLAAPSSAGKASGTVNDRIVEGIAKLGENIVITRFALLEGGGTTRVSSYIHAGGKIGTLVAVEADDPSSAGVETLAHNVAMHVAATNPAGLTRDDIPADEVESERSVLRKQAEGEGKPANVVEKMVEGRLGKYFKEIVLLEQPLVMDPDQTVEKAAKAAGGRVTGFRRFQLGDDGEAGD